MLVKIQFTALLAGQAARKLFHNSKLQFFPFSLSLSLCALCAIIQIYAKYKTLLATFWHPLDLALSIRLVELICFDCPRRPRLPPSPSLLSLSLPACLHYYLSNQLSTQSAITSCHLPLPLTLSLFPSLVLRAFCVLWFTLRWGDVFVGLPLRPPFVEWERKSFQYE